MKNLLRSYLISSVIIFSFEPLAINTEAEGFRINNGASTEVDVHSDCLEVSNASGEDIFVPTATSSEWTTFQNNLPTGVTTGACSGGGTPLSFSGSTKTETNCINDGGSVVSTVDGTLCRFNAGACPAGWSNADNWSTTTVNTGTGSFGSYSCSFSLNSCKGPLSTAMVSTFSGGSEALTTGSHAWSNTAVEFDQCLIPTGCTQVRNAECDDGAWTYDGTSASPGSNTFCGGVVLNSTTARVVLRFDPSTTTIGGYGQVETGYSRIDANITQIGCR